MLEILYSVVIIVCLAGDCDAFIIDDGVTLADCIEQLTLMNETTPNYMVPGGECRMDSVTI